MYTVEFRVAALRVYEFLGSLRRTATALGVAPPTISRWKTRLAPAGWPPRGRHAQLADAIRSLVSSALADRPWSTRTELKALLHQHIGVSLSLKCIGGAIRAAGFAMRRLRRRLTGTKGQPDHATWHESFRRQFTEAVLSGKCVVAVDESGFDQRVTPLYGYVQRGRPANVAFASVPGTRRQNLLLALRSDTAERAAQSIHSGTVKAPDFAAFLRTLGCPKGSVIVLDNAPIHRTRLVLQTAKELEYTLLFTPPYSPLLNPVELVFSVVKRAFRAARGAAHLTAPGTPLTDLVAEAVESQATPGRIAGSFRHVLRVIRENLEN